MGHDRYDVIIVGAGPAGSTAAKICAESNLSVALIEKGEYPAVKTCLAAVSSGLPWKK